MDESALNPFSSTKQGLFVDKAGKITLKLEVEGFGEPVLVELESLAPEIARKNRK